MKEEILEAKRRLYLLLMKLNEDTITDNEADLMFLLSKDEQIQSLFETQTKNNIEYILCYVLVLMEHNGCKYKQLLTKT
jgi:hypothetical protein